MNTTYKKLFDIKYHNKTFTIFIDDYHRRTFLEKNDLGEYIYPTLEDFKALNNIYNIHNPLIEYDLRKYFFKEKVRLTSGVLAITLLATTLGDALATNFQNYQVEETEDSVVITSVEAVKAMHQITDLKELDSILGYTSVRKEQVLEAVNANPNLNNYYKEIIYNLVNRIYEEYPNIDLRVFYENVKTLKINELTNQEFFSQYSENTIANYESAKNTVNFTPDVTLKTIYHEFAHVMWTFYWPELGVYRVATYNSLNEAMTNKIVNLLSPEKNSYINEGLVLDYFLENANFTYEEYMQNGINKLIKQLKENNPIIDFDYICSTLDSMQDTFYKLGIRLSLTENKDLLDELFSLALLNINSEFPYKSFVNFGQLLEQNANLFTEYLNKYNTKLKELGYSLISKEELDKITSQYQEYPYIIGFNEQLYIGKSSPNQLTKFIILDNNEEKEIDISTISIIRPCSNSTVSFQLTYLKNFNTKGFWQKFLKEYGNINNADYKKVPIYLNNKLLIEENLLNLYIQIGKNTQNKVGYLITNKAKEVIYKSDEMLSNLSNYITLYSYMEEYQMKDKIELSYILKDSYLLEVSSSFRNLKIDNNEIKVTPMYMISIIDKYRGGKGYLSDIKLIKANDKVKLSPTLIFLDIDVDEEISLYSVLEYYHLLNEEQTEYSFTIPEITNLITNYINEQKEIKVR